jgi:hypothetical protein
MAEDLKLLKGCLTIESLGKKYIYKPLDFFTDGFKTVPYNEILAYKLSSYYGFNIVPFTGMNTTERFGKGSFQEFVDDSVPLHLYDGGVINSKMATTLFIFDVLTGNTDRKEENILVDSKGNLFAIDNGFTLGFHSLSELGKRDRDYLWNLNPYAIEGGYLGITSRITKLVHKETLYSIMNHLQDMPFMYKTTDYIDYDDEKLWQDVKEIIQWRIKNLPALIWQQII